MTRLTKLPNNPDLRILSETYGKQRKAKSGTSKPKRSRSVTPSGKGYGHTDDAQHYEWKPPDHRASLRQQAKNSLSMLEWHARRAGIQDEEPVAQAFASLGELMRWLDEVG